MDKILCSLFGSGIVRCDGLKVFKWFKAILGSVNKDKWATIVFIFWSLWLHKNVWLHENDVVWNGKFGFDRPALFRSISLLFA